MRTRNAMHLGRLVSIASLALAATWPAAALAWQGGGVPICTETHAQAPESIVSDGIGGAIVVWVDYRAGAEDIYAQRVDSSGAVLWSANGVAVCTAGGLQIEPDAAAYLDGGAAMVWWDERNGGADIYAQRLDGNGVALWTFNGIALAISGNSETDPLVIGDGSAGIVDPPGWIVLFHSDLDSNHQNLRMQHVDAGGGGLWTPAASGGVPLTSVPDSRIGFPRMSTDGMGSPGGPRGAIVTWDEVRGTGPGVTYDIYARRITGGGVPQWAANGVAVCALTGAQGTPDIVHVGGGDVILAWGDGRTGDFDIYAQKLNSLGAAQWLANGLPVCRALSSQVVPRIASDGAGGVIAVWDDFRSGVRKVWAQRIDGNGQSLWLLDGVPLCSGAGEQRFPTIISDNHGGAIVAWTDFRDGNEKVYLQRVSSTGNLLWPSEGVQIAPATSVQDRAGLATDGQSGVIASWRANFDVFATRIYGGGSTVDVPDAPLGRTPRLAFVSSNPAKGEVRMRLELSEAAFVRAEVLDPLGRHVRTLGPGADLGGGTHLITWDGADDAGAPVPEGVFFVSVRAGAERLVTRVVELR